MAYGLLYQSSCVLSCIVSLVYWGLLAPKEIHTLNATRLFISIGMHGFNLVLMATEMGLSRNPFVASHLAIYMPAILLFVPYTFAIHPIDNKWPYFFFDYEEDPVLFACVLVGVVVAATLFHVLFLYLHRLRDARLARQSPKCVF